MNNSLPIIKIGDRAIELNEEQKSRLMEYIKTYGKSNEGYRKLIVELADEVKNIENGELTKSDLFFAGPPVEKEMVNHPNHYGGKDNPYETIKVIDAWELDFCLGNCVKYISRAGKKGKDKELEDLKKAAFYLNYKINKLSGKNG
jgi:hypothetical protein